MNTYFLDACALIALLSGEKGAENVRSLIKTAHYKQYALRTLLALSMLEKLQSPAALCGFFL